jgi:hypothetical protein
VKPPKLKLAPEQWLERFWPATGAMLHGSVPGHTLAEIAAAWPGHAVTHDPDRYVTGEHSLYTADGSHEKLFVEPVPGEARYILQLADVEVAKALAKLVRARLKRELGAPTEKTGSSMTWHRDDKHRVYFATYKAKIYAPGFEEDGAPAAAMNLVVSTSE